MIRGMAVMLRDYAQPLTRRWLLWFVGYFAGLVLVEAFLWQTTQARYEGLVFLFVGLAAVFGAATLFVAGQRILLSQTPRPGIDMVFLTLVWVLVLLVIWGVLSFAGGVAIGASLDTLAGNPVGLVLVRHFSYFSLWFFAWSLLRFGLVLPATAIRDRATGFLTSFRVTRPHRWTLAIYAAIPSILVASMARNIELLAPVIGITFGNDLRFTVIVLVFAVLPLLLVLVPLVWLYREHIVVKPESVF